MSASACAFFAGKTLQSYRSLGTTGLIKVTVDGVVFRKRSRWSTYDLIVKIENQSCKQSLIIHSKYFPDSHWLKAHV